MLRFTLATLLALGVLSPGRSVSQELPPNLITAAAPVGAGERPDGRALLGLADQALAAGLSSTAAGFYAQLLADLAEPAFRSIAWGGRYLVVGFAGGAIPSLPLNLPLLKGASVVGVFWGAFEQREPVANARHLAQLMEWVANGTIAPVVSARYPLDRGAAALRAMLDRQVVGKVVIVPVS